MVAVTVRVPGLLARFTDSNGALDIEADTVEECLDRLVENHPALEFHLFDERGDLREHLQVFVDDRNTDRFAEQPIRLEPGATVTILQAVSGG